MTFEEIKKISKDFIDLKKSIADNESNRLYPIVTSIETDEANRKNLVNIEKSIQLFQQEYSEYTSEVKPFFTINNVEYYAGVEAEEDLQEVVDGAFLKENNIFFHTVTGWDSLEPDVDPEPTATPDLYNVYGYNDWSVNKANTYTQTNTVNIAHGIKKAIESYNNGEATTDFYVSPNYIMVNPYTVDTFTSGVSFSLPMTNPLFSVNELALVCNSSCNGYSIFKVTDYDLDNIVLEFVEALGSAVVTTTMQTKIYFTGKFNIDEIKQKSVPITITTKAITNKDSLLKNGVATWYSLSDSQILDDNAYAYGDDGTASVAIKNIDTVSYVLEENKYKATANIALYINQETSSITIYRNKLAQDNMYKEVILEGITELVNNLTRIVNNINANSRKQAEDVTYAGTITSYITSLNSWKAANNFSEVSNLNSLINAIDTSFSNRADYIDGLNGDDFLLDERKDIIATRINKFFGTLNAVYRATLMINTASGLSTNDLKKITNYKKIMNVKKVEEDGTGNFYAKVETGGEALLPNDTVYAINDNSKDLGELITIRGTRNINIPGDIDYYGNIATKEVVLLALNKKMSRSNTKEANARIVKLL